MIKAGRCILLFILISGVSSGYVGLSPGISAAGSSAMDEGMSGYTGDSQPVDMAEMAETISRLSQGLKKQQSERDKLLKESDNLAEKILKEKRKAESKSSRTLDSLLRESHELVGNLELLSGQIGESESQLRQKYSLAITSLVRLMENKPDEKEQKIFLKQLVKYLRESEKLEKPIELEIHKVSLEIQDNDTPDQIRKKADFLSDQTTLLKAKIFQIKEQIAKLERERSLRDKVKKFADEISFFDDSVMLKENRISQGEQGVVVSEPISDKSGTPVDNSGETLIVDPPSGPTDAYPDSQISESTRGEAALSPIIRIDAFDSSPSDLILSGKSIDKQIDLLEGQKSNLGNQIQELLEKAQNFYNRADKLGSSNLH